MKKILSLLVVFGLGVSSTSAVISCKFFDPEGGGSTNPGEIPKDFEPIELSQLNLNFDYVYKTKEEYKKASEYYLYQALKQGEATYDYLSDGETVEKRAVYSDFIFQSGAWYGNEAQWDLIRVDEFEGNYKYDEIDIDSLTQNSYSREWYQNRNKILKKYVDYYSGVADELKGDKDQIYYAYDGGMNKALLQYKNSKQYQIDNPILPGIEESLKEDMKFIDNLTKFWALRFNRIKKLSEKINDILVNWND
ncbi:hypothetical protein [Spiroplasma endosymbiont of Cantharis lateralis]|uniref:hypothetical protein n=1 Tax=Spiroplasma endosymbiont of Cantharis lateralis TaxID=3066277 RepID=UPI00313E9EA3